MISIIIPVLNEAAIIGRTLEGVLQQGGTYEVLVVDGGSSDGTQEIVTEFPVTLVRKPASLPRGVGSQLNLGARSARGDVLLFLHADVRLPPEGTALVERVMADRAVVGGGFLPAFEGQRLGVSRLTLTLVERAWQTRTRVFRWFAGDTAPFVRREALMAGGGYPIQPLAEDWAFAWRLRTLGRLAVIEQPVRVSARRHLRNGVVRTLLVTGSVELMYHARVDAGFLAWWYRRWLPRERDALPVEGGPAQ